jgi:hypothetical protein
MPRLRATADISAALQSEDIVKAASVISNVHEAMMTLASLDPPALEALRDEFEEMAKTRTGPRGVLKRAWFEFTKAMIEDAKIRERQGEFGLYHP